MGGKQGLQLSQTAQFRAEINGCSAFSRFAVRGEIVKSALKELLPLPIKCRLKRSLIDGPFFRKRTLSQARQDLWVINEVFWYKKNGYFVELGSADGLALNNTFLLEHRYGWKGICVEANPDSFEELRLNRTADCINACVDANVGQVRFWKNGLLGGILSHDTDNAAPRGDPDDTILIDTIPLIDILRKCEAPRIIDYLSVDLEGAETRALKEFPFKDYRFLAMTIERPSQELDLVLKANDYIPVKMIPNLDVFYIHRCHVTEYANTLARFSGASGFCDET